MCGIAGAVNFNGAPVSPQDVKEMCRRLVHRGPDEEGYHVSEHAVLGVQRLKIVGLVNGSQPVSNQAGTVFCVFNGEIYNYRELRESLIEEGYVFKTSTDAEVIVHLYDKLGLSFVKSLRGMWAIALYDTTQRRLVLAKDIAGKKPLHYHVTKHGNVIFASELNSLVSHPEVQKTISAEAVDRFLSYRIIPAPLTIYNEIFKVEPGTIVVFADGNVTKTKYWSFDFSTRFNGLSEADLVEQLRKLLLESVERRLYSEVPLGALLSGGLDSSLIVAIMSRLRKDPIHTFSIGFEDRNFNELRFARLVSEHCKTIYHEYIISPDEAIAAIRQLLVHYGEPYAFPSAIACYFMSWLARQFVTVVLTGDGADEVFCGYDRYKIFAELPRLPERPNWLARVDLDLLEQARGDLAVEYQSILTDGLRDSLKRRLYSRSFINQLGEFPANYVREKFARQNGLPNRLTRAMDVDCNFWLPDAQLVKIDIASMAHSIEVRCPMLDQSILEFATGINVSHKLANGNEKHLLKLVAQEFLPPEITSRPKKELAVPLENWLASSLREEITSTLLADETLARGYFDPDALIEFVKDFQIADSYSIWTLYILEQWHRLTSEAAPAAVLCEISVTSPLS